MYVYGVVAKGAEKDRRRSTKIKKKIYEKNND